MSITSLSILPINWHSHHNKSSTHREVDEKYVVDVKHVVYIAQFDRVKEGREKCRGALREDLLTVSRELASQGDVRDEVASRDFCHSVS